MGNESAPIVEIKPVKIDYVTHMTEIAISGPNILFCFGVEMTNGGVTEVVLKRRLLIPANAVEAMAVKTLQFLRDVAPRLTPNAAPGIVPLN